MKLSDWLQSRGIKPAQFARQLGREASTIHRIITGERQPSAELVAQIDRATQGAVSLGDFYKTADADEESHPGAPNKDVA